jgi:uncharacterized protein YfaS (alpha-2-macroglobulin family)
LQAYRTYQSIKKSPMAYQFPKNGSYEKEWKRVDSLQSKGLSKSALEIVSAIYAKSKMEKNTENFIRAIIEKMKYESYLEEDSYVKAIGDLERDAAESEFPIKQIIHTVAAETYWMYYQNNRHVFLNRTVTSNYENKDIRTWDFSKLLEKVDLNYQLSLTNAAQSKNTPLSKFNAIVIDAPGSKEFRPTLYDFLWHRALDYYMNEEPEITKPNYAFELESADYFSNYLIFQGLKITTKDSTSRKLEAVKLLQQLLQFHAPDKDPRALIDIDLKRLKYVKQHATHPNKDSLYLQSLRQIETSFASSPSSAEASYLVANYYWEKGNSEADENTNSSQKNYKQQAMQKCESTIKKFQDSEGAKNCAYLKSLILEKSLSISLEDATLPNKPSLALIKFKNVKKAYFKIVELPATNEFDLDKGVINDVLKSMLAEKGVASWSLDLPNDADYTSHRVQIKMPALPFGHYLIFVGSDASFSTLNQGMGRTNFWVSSISYITQRKPDGTYDGYVLHRESGKALQNINLQLWREKYDYTTRKYVFVKMTSLGCDANGKFSLPDSDNQNFYIEFKGPNNDRLCSDYGFYRYRDYDEGERSYTHSYFFTDRKIYRPGQTIYFKGIVIQKTGKENKLLSKLKSEVIFSDVNGQKVSSLELTTNEYGTYSGSFVAPQGVLNGQMSISNGSGTCFFSVEEYKRPKFEIVFDALKGAYLLGDSVTVSGKAISYSGAVLDDAQVNYRVVREAVFPYWWYFWRSYPVTSPAMEIGHGSLNTDKNGAYSISFSAIPDLLIEKNNSSSFNYTVYVDVTDSNGETHSAQKSVNIGYVALQLDVNIPSLLDKNSKENLKVKTHNFNGDYVAAKGSIRIFKLKQPTRIYRERKWEKPDRFIIAQEEFHALFPNDLYADENNEFKWERGEKIADISFDTDTLQNKKAGEFVLKNLEKWIPGKYVWEAISYDKNKQEVKAQNIFTVVAPLEKMLPTADVNHFSVLVNKGEPGDIAKISIGSQEKDVQVLFEVECKNELVKSEWINLNEEQKLIEIPIEEKHRGNFAAHFTFVKNNRAYKNTAVIEVPYTNKELDITFETFRNKLLPGQDEEWKIRIKDKKGNKVAAEMMATLYDASLDAMAANDWMLNLYSNYYSHINWETANSFKINHAQLHGKNWNVYGTPVSHSYDVLNWFGYEGYSYFGYRRGEVLYDSDMSAAPMSMQASSPAEMSEKRSNSRAETEDASALGNGGLKEIAASSPEKKKNKTTSDEVQEKQPQIRKNFNETAFFYPNLETNEEGELLIKFKLPESLTKWKMLGLAHSKDLQIGKVVRELQTQKDLMVSLYAPRFLREGDRISLVSKINNLSAKDLNGKVKLQLFNAISMQDITHELLGTNANSNSFEVKNQQSTTTQWELIIPAGIEAITYRISATSAVYTDAEEMTLPVLTNRMLVTESLPLPMRGNAMKEFTFSKLLSQNNQSSTLRNYKVSLEFTSNPAWYAIQSLPYLMEYPYACSEQTFSRYYANSIASHIANSNPKIKSVFESWKINAGQTNSESLLSNLEKNDELKDLLLQETPWIMQAKGESERKKRLALLFDLNKMQNDLERDLSKLKKMQNPNGGWPWFEGMPDDKYITQHIVTGMGHLDHLGIKSIRNDDNIFSMVRAAVLYMDARVYDDYQWLLKHEGARLKENHLSYTAIQYLYSRSYFNDIEISQKHKVAFDFYKNQAQKYWLSQSRYMQAMTALALHRYSEKLVATDILKSLKENSISNPELGMYWKENTGGFYWYQAPIETQAMLIEAFDEVTNDQESVESMKVWLLKNKQTNDWKTTKATTEACYALLLRGTDWLDTEPAVEIRIGDKIVNPKSGGDIKVEAGTGYFKTNWNGEEISAKMGTIKVSPLSKNSTQDKVMWGAVYWQYFENLDKISSHETPLKLKKKIFVEKITATGPILVAVDANSEIKVGDKLKIRIELQVDRDMEYVQMKDMRGSGLEPINVFSGYKYQDGLGYYESTKDAATNFFFSYLRKGSYVFEYPLRVAHSGNFSNGITSIQCMYAPEFTSHSEGARLEVKK